jgi:hypothetical protein
MHNNSANKRIRFKHYDPCKLILPAASKHFKGIFKGDVSWFIQVYNYVIEKIIEKCNKEKTCRIKKDDIKILLDQALDNIDLQNKGKAKRLRLYIQLGNDLRRLCILKINSVSNWSPHIEAYPAEVLDHLIRVVNFMKNHGIDYSEYVFYLVILLCIAYGDRCDEEACLCRKLKERDLSEVLDPELYSFIKEQMKSIGDKIFQLLPLSPNLFSALRKVIGVET